MQTDQELSTTQNKKTASAVKKVEKKPKVTKTEVMEEKLTVPEQKAEVVSSVAPSSSVTLPLTTQTTNELNSEATIIQDNDEINNMIEFLNSTSDRLMEITKYFKDNIMSKDERNKLETSFKKFNKSTAFYQNGYTEYLSKQVSLLEKSSSNKSTSNKKVTDKTKAAIHKKLAVHPFLLNFMKLEPNTLVSRSDALTAITGYVKQEKIKNPDIILSTDKKTFKLIGELKPLFDGIKDVMLSKKLLVDTQMPTEIKYTQIMQYMTHCFVTKQEE